MQHYEINDTMINDTMIMFYVSRIEVYEGDKRPPLMVHELQIDKAVNKRGCINHSRGNGSVY